MGGQHFHPEAQSFEGGAQNEKGEAPRILILLNLSPSLGAPRRRTSASSGSPGRRDSAHPPRSAARLWVPVLVAERRGARGVGAALSGKLRSPVFFCKPGGGGEGGGSAWARVAAGGQAGKGQGARSQAKRCPSLLRPGLESKQLWTQF